MAHGGAGAKIVTPVQLRCLADALATGHAIMRSGGAALAAVEAAIKVMEGSGLFNAGTGAYLKKWKKTPSSTLPRVTRGSQGATMCTSWPRAATPFAIGSMKAPGVSPGNRGYDVVTITTT